MIISLLKKHPWEDPPIAKENLAHWMMSHTDHIQPSVHSVSLSLSVSVCVYIYLYIYRYLYLYNHCCLCSWGMEVKWKYSTSVIEGPWNIQFSDIFIWSSFSSTFVALPLVHTFCHRKLFQILLGMWTGKT